MRSWSQKSGKNELRSLMIVIWSEMIGDHDHASVLFSDQTVVLGGQPSTAAVIPSLHCELKIEKYWFKLWVPDLKFFLHSFEAAPFEKKKTLILAVWGAIISASVNCTFFRNFSHSVLQKSTDEIIIKLCVKRMQLLFAPQQESIVSIMNLRATECHSYWLLISVRS